MDRRILMATPSRQSAIYIAAPALMVTYGAVSLKSRILEKLDNRIKTNLLEKNYLFRTHIDDYLQFVPTVAAFGMRLAGVQSVHKLGDMIAVCALSNLLETGIVYAVKRTSARMRPDGSTNNSFPSGHTATAFVAAEFLHQEYGHISAWFSICGYAAATLVGAGRIFNNRHWLSDVIAGAGIGILSTKMVYWTYPSLRKMFNKKKTKTLHSFFSPSYINNFFSLNFTGIF
ncbi:MAG: phosphatase PAP2 family protein [Prevotellaceae bacterium]|nr:phosphatase PAP2 family protein [Prevotellaceae bacterium]